MTEPCFGNSTEERMKGKSRKKNRSQQVFKDKCLRLPCVGQQFQNAGLDMLSNRIAVQEQSKRLHKCMHVYEYAWFDINLPQLESMSPLLQSFR